MAKLAVLNTKGEKVKDITLDNEIWNIEPNNSVIYDAVRLIRSALRQGTSANKSRGMVSGSTRKLYKQKGTGNARVGSARAPHRTGGGVAFAKVPRDFSIKMNRKEKKLALRSAISYKVTDKALIIVDKLDLQEVKTKLAKEIMKNIKAEDKSLIVMDAFDENVSLSFRNLKRVKVINATSLNTMDVMNYKTIVIVEDAIKSVEEVLS